MPARSAHKTAWKRAWATGSLAFGGAAASALQRGTTAVVGSLVVGLVVGLLQATTQVQEPTLTFVPKLLAVFLVLALSAPWMGVQLLRFTQALFEVGGRYRRNM